MDVGRSERQKRQLWWGTHQTYWQTGNSDKYIVLASAATVGFASPGWELKNIDKIGGARDRTKHKDFRKQPKSAPNKLLQAETGLTRRFLFAMIG